jgi:hypothetical protein
MLRTKKSENFDQVAPTGTDKKLIALAWVDAGRVGIPQIGIAEGSPQTPWMGKALKALCQTDRTLAAATLHRSWSKLGEPRYCW